MAYKVSVEATAGPHDGTVHRALIEKQGLIPLCRHLPWQGSSSTCLSMPAASPVVMSMSWHVLCFLAQSIVLTCVLVYITLNPQCSTDRAWAFFLFMCPSKSLNQTAIAIL